MRLIANKREITGKAARRLRHQGRLPAVVYGEGIALPVLENYDEKLTEKIHRLQVSDLRIRVDQRMREGDAASEILAEAEQSDADLIAMRCLGPRYQFPSPASSISPAFFSRAVR